MRRAAGLDIGGTTVKAVVVDPDGNAHLRTTFATGDGMAADYRARVPSHLREIEAAHGVADAVGIAAPGLAAPDGRSIAWMMGRMAGLMGLDWTTHLGRDRAVRVVNDAHAALLGERWLGAARGRRDVLMLTLGTGVGGAAICDGRLLRGHLGRAGHFGHVTLEFAGAPDICGTPGSLEDAVGNHSVARRSDGRFAGTRDLIDAMERGDLEARRLWDRSLDALAAAVVSLVNALDPQRVIIGGGIATVGATLFDGLRARVARLEWRPTGAAVEIVPAELGEYAGAFGAAHLAMQGDAE